MADALPPDGPFLPHDGAKPADTGPVPLRPDNLTQFRLARLALLLDLAPQLPNAKPLDVERLGYYDFFAANPFLIIKDDDPLRRELVLAGFDSRNLSYQSSAQRFTSRRARLQHDLAMLVAYGLVHVHADQRRVIYALTEAGEDMTAALRSLYARAYRRSVDIIVRRLNRLSDKALRESAQDWLAAEGLLIDLYDVETA